MNINFLVLLAIAVPILAQTDLCASRAEGFYCAEDRSTYIWCFGAEALSGFTNSFQCPSGSFCDCPAGEVCPETGPCSGMGQSGSEGMTEGAPSTPSQTVLSSESSQTESSQSPSETESSQMSSQSPSETESSQMSSTPSETFSSQISDTVAETGGSEPSGTEPSGTETGTGEPIELAPPPEFPPNFSYEANIQTSTNGVLGPVITQNVYSNADEGLLRIDLNGVRQYYTTTSDGGALERTFDESSRVCETTSLTTFPTFSFDPRYEFQQNTLFEGQQALLYTYNTPSIGGGEQGLLYIAEGLDSIPLFESVTVTRETPELMGVTQTNTTYVSFDPSYPSEVFFELPPECLLGGSTE